MNMNSATSRDEFYDLLSNISVGIIQRYAKNKNLVTALEMAMPIILDSIKAEAISLFLVNEDKTELKCEICLGPVDIKGITVKVNSGLVGKAFTSKEGLLIKDAKLDSSHNSEIDQKTGFQTHSLLTVPILSGETAFGCLQAINRLENGQIHPFTDLHLEAFLRLASMLGIALENVALADQMVKDALIMKDLSAAEEIQTNLYTTLDHIDQISGVVIPARNLSGDFVDYIQVKNRIFFCEGDVSGKGIPAALTVARCSALFRLFVKVGLEPLEIAQKINSEMFDTGSRFGKSAGFITFCVGILDLSNGDCKLVNCGHGDLVVTDRERNMTTYGSSLPPLGVVATEDLKWDTLELDLTNKKLFIFTDGLLESKPSGGKVLELGLEGVKSLIKYVCDLPPKKAVTKLMSLFSNNTLVTGDDATLLVLGV